MPFVLGHALSLNAIHGGKAQNDTSDAHQHAVRLRGGMLPQAYLYPAEMRATRDWRRRRIAHRRPRAERWTQGQHTHRQYTWPEIGKKLA